MPPFSTPFRLPASRRPNSARPGSQFASTPRFILSQTPSNNRRGSDDDLIDAESPESTPLPTGRVRRDRDTRPIPKDVIEDSDELGQSDGDPDSNSENAGEVDSEFEALFGPTRAKRRRVSLEPVSLDPETPFTQRRKRDNIQTSSPETSPTRDRAVNHIPPEATETPSTPAPTKPSFRSNPRFVLADSQLPSSTQPQFSTRVPASTAPPSSTQRKPAFVLPRSPSPSRGREDPLIPTPFSPSARALGRRGRRPGAPSYLPGGMAAEVRSWILEMGSKRDQMDLATEGVPDLQKYFLVVRVVEARQSSLANSGPLAFVRGRPVSSLDDENIESQLETRNVMLMGPPRARQTTPGLGPGNLVGVHRGLVWEVDLDQTENTVPEVGPEDTGSGKESIQMPGKWLVGMEWELISEH
ncbi:hypothetical protein BDV25DRAFT_73449 [Aspergillus avenaceus]|uniref:Uncharacterized protein n=1 Tax=Aspergillus avenaceus TaxID=36643 RepID=A0A5N6U0V4_ASPAV|nr:hypothetical protein BDV25DRAFT_73449 [Aspergillus avenaceus]